jgi:xanthine dehydrogenase accessory factor
MAEWLDALTKLDCDGEPAVLVTVLSTRGSTPREAGCKMVVTREAQFGTIGGGNLEYRCVADARTLLAGSGTQPLTRDFPLGPALGQCCGGHVSVLFEPIRPSAMHIALFGAGHVGRAVVRLLGDLPCRVTWIDSRADAFPAGCPANTSCHVVEEPETEVAGLPAGTRLLVMTHDHQSDFAIVAAALARDDFAGVGLIGSETKRARFIGRLRRLGLDDTAIARLECPIGLPEIDSKLPSAIAVGVVARLLSAVPAVTRPPVATTACLDCARHPEGVCA